MGSEHWDDNGCCTRCGTKGNAYQVCVNCSGLSQHGLAMQQNMLAAQMLYASSNRIAAGLANPGRCDAIMYGIDCVLQAGHAGDHHGNADGVRLLHEKLAVSEKERERLKAQLNEKTPHVDPMTGICTGCGTSRMERAAQDGLRRELENLKRSTDNTIRDQFGYIERLEKDNSDAAVRIAFIERELDRERAKRKRGL